MNIRPLDLQVMIPKTTEVGKSQQAVDQQPILQQQYFAEKWQQITSDRQQQVQSMVKGEGGTIRDEQSPQHRQKRSSPGISNKPAKRDDVQEGNRSSLDHDPICGQLADIKA